MISPCLKAAAALQAISLESPIKPTKKPNPVIDDARRSLSPHSEVESKEDEELDLPRRFVGDVDLPESVLIRLSPIDSQLTGPFRSGAAAHGI